MMMQDWIGLGKVKNVAKSSLEIKQFTVNGKTPVVNAAQQKNLISYILDCQGFLMERDTEFFSTAQLFKILPQFILGI